MISALPGTYILLLGLTDRSTVEFGRGNRAELAPGLYAYVGSALGPGGLAARLRRHASSGVRMHWHVDFLLPHVELMGALVVDDGRRHECSWASWVGENSRLCIPGFGASDCRCRGHLFYLDTPTDGDNFIELAQQELGARFASSQELRSDACMR